MKRTLNILNLQFKSILNERPRKGQFILMAFDINGYSGYESIYWEPEEYDHCKYCVMWTPLSEKHVFTRHDAVRKVKKVIPPILKWSEHYSYNVNGYYISQNRLRKDAIEL